MDSDADALYGLPRDEFIARRGELAKSLRKDGRRDEAAEVAALRKPSVAAWAVNQLVRTQRSPVHKLFDAGDALRDAQSDLLAGEGDGRALRSASDRERAAVEDLADRARGLLSAAGDELSPAVLERVADTLHAAALDEAARDQVRDGRLERELRHVGLGLGLGEIAAFAPEPRRPRAQQAGSTDVEVATGKRAAGSTGAAGERARARTEANGPAGKRAAGSTGAGERERADAATPAKTSAASKRAAAKRERERAEAERAAAEQARRERAAAIKAARAGQVAARRRADAAARALTAAEAHRERAAQALSEAEGALAAARDDAARANAAHEQARAEVDDAERQR